MASLCCSFCARGHHRDVMIRLALREPYAPCGCPCHRNEPVGEPARGIFIGVVLVTVPWLIVGLVTWAVLS